MMDSVELFLFATAILLISSVLLSKASGKFGIPTLVVFLAVGILAGSEGLGGIYFDNAYYSKILGIVSLTYILFSGGLDTNWKSVRPVIKSSLSLSTLGVLLTCLLVGSFVHFFLNLSWAEGLLIGAIISSTDAGAVFTVLRSSNISLKDSVKSTLEFESGSNDPMAVFLVTSFISVLQIENFSILSLLPKLIQQMFLGAGVGYFAGLGMVWAFNKLRLEFEGLYIVFSLAMVLIIYTTTQSIEGNGFLSVYVAGVVLGNKNFVFKKSLILFHDGISWLMQTLMFVTFGLLIFPTNVIRVTAPGLVIAMFMIFIARPVSVFLSLSFSEFNWREKLLISWVGLRGSVPIIMATFPLVAGVGNAEYMFNLVFFVAVTSLLFQGTTIRGVAKLLKLLSDDHPSEKHVEYSSHGTLSSNLSIMTIPAESSIINKSIVELELPQDLLIVSIERKGDVIIPRGATQFKEGDKLMVVANKESLDLLKGRVSS